MELPSLLPDRQETIGKRDGCDFHVHPGVLSVLVSGGQAGGLFIPEAVFSTARLPQTYLRSQAGRRHEGDLPA